MVLLLRVIWDFSFSVVVGISLLFTVVMFVSLYLSCALCTVYVYPVPTWYLLVVLGCSWHGVVWCGVINVSWRQSPYCHQSLHQPPLPVHSWVDSAHQQGLEDSNTTIRQKYHQQQIWGDIASLTIYYKSPHSITTLSIMPDLIQPASK